MSHEDSVLEPEISDELLEFFEGVEVEGGFNDENEDDACVGGACKI